MSGRNAGPRKHRADVDRRREQNRGIERAAAAERQAAEAEEWQKNFARTVQRYERRRRIGWILIGLSIVMFATHILEHTGDLTLFSPKLEDVLIGFPTAGVLMVIAVIFLGQIHPAERQS